MLPGSQDDPEAAEARRAERDALLMDGVAPGDEEELAGETGAGSREALSSAEAAGSSFSLAGASAGASADARPRSNMPLILSVSVPGLGHALYGAPIAGIVAVILSLILVLACVYAFVVTLFLLMGSQPVLKPLLVLGGLLSYGLIFTGLVAWDARELEDRDGKVTVYMHGAIISAFVVLLGALWLLR